VIIREHLELLASLRKSPRRRPGYVYESIEDFVLREGESFPWREKPKSVRFGRQKECFKNAMHLAIETGWTYCEGYAMGYFPTMHAWVVDDEGFVIDNTWRDDQPAREYLGVRMTEDFVTETVLAKGTYGVIEDYERRFPILKQQWVAVA
jgi:hypothetical protein